MLKSMAETEERERRERKPMSRMDGEGGGAEDGEEQPVVKRAGDDPGVGTSINGLSGGLGSLLISSTPVVHER